MVWQQARLKGQEWERLPPLHHNSILHASYFRKGGRGREASKPAIANNKSENSVIKAKNIACPPLRMYTYCKCPSFWKNNIKENFTSFQIVYQPCTRSISYCHLFSTNQLFYIASFNQLPLSLLLMCALDHVVSSCSHLVPLSGEQVPDAGAEYEVITWSLSPASRSLMLV